MDSSFYDKDTQMIRVTQELNMKYLVLSFFDNSTSYAYGCSTDKDMIQYVNTCLNYKPQAGSAAVKHVQVYKVDSTQYTLTIFHDIEV